MSRLEDTLSKPGAPDFLGAVRGVEDAIRADQWGRAAAQPFIEPAGSV
jgi:hypothetical protein